MYIVSIYAPGDRERRKVRGSKAQTTNTSHMVQHSYHAIDIVSAMRQCVHQPSAHSCHSCAGRVCRVIPFSSGPSRGDSSECSDT